MKKKYEHLGLRVIGIHTPEFEFEKEREQVVRVAKRHGSDYPIMMDNDYSYWRALQNRYWPSFYLIDQTGEIVVTGYGEMHAGEKRAEAIETAIKQLLF
jgi:hypothetical protein